MRSVAIQAGLRPGYIYEVIKYGRDPSLSSMLKVCDVLETDLIWLCYGLPALPGKEEVLRTIESLSSEQRRALLLLLKQ
jgi:hypothetical protein